MGEAIDLLFVLVTWVGQRNHLLDVYPEPQGEETIFEVVRPTEKCMSPFGGVRSRKSITA